MSKMCGLPKMRRGWPTPHVSAARQHGMTFRRDLLWEYIARNDLELRSNHAAFFLPLV